MKQLVELLIEMLEENPLNATLFVFSLSCLADLLGSSAVVDNAVVDCVFGSVSNFIVRILNSAEMDAEEMGCVLEHAYFVLLRLHRKKGSVDGRSYQEPVLKSLAHGLLSVYEKAQRMFVV